MPPPYTQTLTLSTPSLIIVLTHPQATARLKDWTAFLFFSSSSSADDDDDGNDGNEEGEGGDGPVRLSRAEAGTLKEVARFAGALMMMVQEEEGEEEEVS